MPLASTEWVKELLSCMENVPEFVFALCLPCLANASARTSFDNSDWYFNVMCVNTSTARNMVREGYRIQGTWVEDMFVPWLCNPCVITQTQAEVNKRGPKTHMLSSSPGDWQTQPFACLENPVPFVYALCLPNCAAGTAYSNFDPNQNCIFTTLCVGPVVVRNVVREAYGIKGTCSDDILWVVLCRPCAITQVYMEIEKRGGGGRSAAPKTQGMK